MLYACFIFVSRLLDFCLMIAWSCKRGITLLLYGARPQGQRIV